MAGHRRLIEHSGGRWIAILLSTAIGASAWAGSAGSAATPASGAPSDPLPPAALPVVTSSVVCPPVPGRPQTLIPAAWPSGTLLSDIQAATQLEMAEFVEAVGNPDTGSDSDAMAAFKASLTGNDPAAIRSSAAAVIGHLKAACETLAPYLGLAEAEAWSAEQRALHENLASVIGSIRDAAIAGSPSEVDAGWDRFDTLLADHFWQAFAGNSVDRNRVTFPDGRIGTASRSRTGNPASNAFDGSPETSWFAGNVPAPQWIELDLGFEAAIASIRLLTLQSVAGTTDHVVTMRTAGGEEQRLTRFTGATSDRQWLVFMPPTAVTRVRVVRVTTLETPGMVGWREIEIKLAAHSAPAGCSGSTRLPSVAALMSEPTGAGAALDGDETTGWDAGGTRGPGNVRGWLRLNLPKHARPSAIRVLLGPGPADAQYEITWWAEDQRGLPGGKLAPVSAQGGWATASGPVPCTPIQMVDIGVVSAGPAALVREVEVLGSVGP